MFRLWKRFLLYPFGTSENSCIFDDITKFLSKFLTGFFNDGLRENTFDKNIVISRFWVYSECLLMILMPNKTVEMKARVFVTFKIYSKLHCSQFLNSSYNRQLQQPTALIKLHNNSVHVGLKFYITKYYCTIIFYIRDSWATLDFFKYT